MARLGFQLAILAFASTLTTGFAGEVGDEEKQASFEALGYEALAEGRVEEAQALFQRAVEESPDSAEALAGLGFIRMRQWEFQAAEELFERALEAAPRDALLSAAFWDARFWGRLKEGDRAAAAGRPLEAAAKYRAALKVRPGDPHALERLVKLGPAED